MKRPEARKAAPRSLVMGLLALAGCGGGDASPDAAARKSSAAALEAGIDLVVTEVKAPANVSPGQSFTATVKACNRGEQPSYARPQVELFLSADAALTMPGPNVPPAPDQVLLGSVQMPELYPGQCATRNVSAWANETPVPKPEGAYYLAAAVDTTHAEQESREDNNLHVAGLIGLGYQPDLVVTAVQAPDNVRQGYGFTATVEVCNQGTATMQGGSYYPYYDRARVELYLSMDPELTLPDPSAPSPSIPMDQVSIGYVEVDTLYPGQCMKRPVYASSDLPPAAQGEGAYYLIAAVDPTRLESELREENNVFVKGLMGVGNQPDLVVAEVSGPPSARSWSPFQARVKVCNQGTEPSYGGYASGPQLALFLTESAALSMPAPGQPLDPMPVMTVSMDQTLYPGQCFTQTVNAPASLPPNAQGDGAYYLSAAIDTNHTEQELREDNNVRVGGRMGVGYRSDLVVTEVKAPTNVWPHQSFLATVKVCNQGTESTSYYPRPRLELFLSQDTELTLPDPYMPYPPPSMDQVSIGYVEVDPLQPGQCATKSVPAYAEPPPGAQNDEAYYLAAAIDTQQAEQELREDNNVFVKGLMGVGHGSDLVVTELGAPGNLRHGEGFTATVKLCNQGTESTSYWYGTGLRVELFLSMDAELTVQDPYVPSGPQVDQRSIGYVELYETLYPAQCVTKNAYVYADLPPAAQGMPGTYYLAAVADSTGYEPELREDNNVFVKGKVGVGNRPDLVVTELKAPTSFRHGQNFVAKAKVCNQGTASTNGGYYSSTPRLELFLSMDQEVTLQDPYSPSSYPAMDQRSLGYVELNETLYEGQCVTKDVYANADVPYAANGMEGAYYLAAAIDTQQVQEELREDNNVFVKGLVGVGNRADLVVTELNAPTSLMQGQGFTASVKVCNQGHASTNSYYSGARLELFLSTDAELTLPDPYMPSPGQPMDQRSIGYVDLEMLYEGQCVTKNVNAHADLPYASNWMEGAYYLAAAVDTNHAEQELREDNNVFVKGLVGVGNRADLAVTELSAPDSVTQGQNFTASVKVCNQGTSPTNGYSYYSRPRVELFLSTDAELTLPDPYMPPSGQPMDQRSIGYVELNNTLYPGQCVTQSVYANADLPYAAQGMEGAYYLAAAVDTQQAEQELREDNNVFVKGLMGVGYRADLVVTGVSAPSSLQPGQGFTASVQVCNQGPYPTSNQNSRVELFLSTNGGLTLPAPYPPMPYPQMDHTSIGYVELNQQLSPGQCVTKSVPASASLPPAAQGMDGAYYLVAAVDTNSSEQELREDNNVFVKGLVGVGYRSDLVVTGLSAPANLTHGQGFTASVKVCNQGAGPVSSSSGQRVDLYLLMEPVLSLPDLSVPMPYPPMDQSFIGYVELNSNLFPGQCLTQSAYVNASLPPASQGMDGTYYLGAAVDAQQYEMELREDNNTFVGSAVGVGHGPDLVVTEVSAPASVSNGQGFTASVKVCNQGTESSSGGYSSGTRVELFLSTEGQLTLPDPYSPMPYPSMNQVSIGYTDLYQNLQPGQCATTSVPVSATLPPASQGMDGAYYLAAAVDTNHAEDELREDNNVFVKGLLGVGSWPDLVVSEVSAPANLEPGQSFTASVKVCNQGTSSTNSYSSGARVELFLTTDGELLLPDPNSPMPYPPVNQSSLGYVQLDQPLYPTQCVTKSVPAQASLPPAANGMDGTYYLVAAIDPQNVEQELREDNNVLVKGTVGAGYRSDLVVTGVNAPASLPSGQSFTASVEVCNQGTATSSSGPRVELWLSMDSELSLPDPNNPYPGPAMDQSSLGYVELNQQLYPGQCVTTSVPASASLPPLSQGMDGAYYLAAAVDTNHHEQELREDNNVFVQGLVGVGFRSDLVVTGLSAPTNLTNGQSFTASVKVCNQGTGPVNNAYGTRVELFMSMDTELTLPEQSMPMPYPPMDQISIGYVELNQYLNPGQCVTKSVPASVMLPPASNGMDGTYYIAAAVDGYQNEMELREDNNTFVGSAVGVGYGPDLVVTEVSAPASLWNGQSFTASVKVCNQGTESTNNSYSGARVEMFLSTEGQLTLPDPYSPMPYPPMNQVSIGYTDLNQNLQPGQCVTTNVPASAMLPPYAQGDGAYYLAAAVDTNHHEQELREDNNVFVKGLIGVGQRPDLVVTEVNAPAIIGNGLSFTASVKVCNQGTDPTSGYSSGARVELFLSMDGELMLPDPSMPMPYPPMEQSSLGYVELDQPLYPGQCATKSLSAHGSLPPAANGMDGTYYLVAAVDTQNAEQELREDNNVFVKGTVGVGYRPDLVVTRVSAPASLQAGQQFTASVEVCNQGTSPTSSYGLGVELLLSMDTDISLQDPSNPYSGMQTDQISIGYVSLNHTLYPGQCMTQSTPSAYASPPPDFMQDGVLYLAAVVDPSRSEQEVREDNNVHVGGLVAMGNGSDLVVSEVSAPASVTQGQPFTANVKVCNQGTSPSSGGYSYGPRVELFLSTDGELLMPDPYAPMPYPPMNQHPIGYVELNQSLNPGQCVTRSVYAHADLPYAANGMDGAYYLAAAVDTNHSEQELREDNNVLVKGLIGVGHNPDLVVTEVSAPASVTQGQPFMADVKVCNQGTTPSSGSSSGPRLELFLSTEGQLTLPDPYSPMPAPPMNQVRIAQVSLDQTLQPGQCVTRSVPAHADLPPAANGMDGAYYLAAAIDTNHEVYELREDNNVLVKGLLGVGQRPDLVVTGVNAPANVEYGQPFTAGVKVCNQGTQPNSGSYYGTRVELFLSMDDQLTLPEPNSPSQDPRADQRSLGYVELNQQLSPGQCVTRDVFAFAFPPQQADGMDGTYFLAAAVDTTHAEQELREDNNVFVQGKLGVGHRSDLVVTGVDAPASIEPGQQFTASVKVCNQGTQPTSSGSDTPMVELFLSMDDELTLPDPNNPYSGMQTDQRSIGQVQLNQQLYPGQCVTKSVPAQAHPPQDFMQDGALYLAAMADTTHREQELREDNNVHVQGLVGVGHRPDLVVTEVSAPANVEPGQSFTASVKVCNQGTSPTSSGVSSTRVELYLSMDEELNLPDPYMPYPGPQMDQSPLGSVELNQQLYPGQCVTKSVPAQAYPPPAANGMDATYYLAAAIDPYHSEQELREDNNVLVRGLMGVGTRADLVVRKVSAPASVGYGQSFTATVEVCNQGTSPTNGAYSGAQVELYLSMDDELTLPDPYMPYPGPPMDQSPLGSVQLNQQLYPGQCVTQTVYAQAYPPPAANGMDGAYYLAAAVDPHHSEQELREDNNVHVQGLMGVGTRSDLVVRAVSAPANVEHGQSFTATVEVCNQGASTFSGSYGTNVELYLSTERELTLPDPSMPTPYPPTTWRSIGEVPLNQPLDAGQCVSMSVPASAYLPQAATGMERTFYLAAAVDPHHSEQELREDNNVFVQGLIGVGYSSDLVVTEVSAPASAEYGQPFTASVKVCNQGTVPSNASSYGTNVELYLSTERELSLPDPSMPMPYPPMTWRSIGQVPLDQSLAPGECVTKSVPASASPPPAATGMESAFYLAAAVDPQHAEQELREDNNVFVRGLMGVGSQPDLVVTSVTGPASMQLWQSGTATVKVCNQGTVPSTQTAWLMVMLSVDAQLGMPTPNSPMPTDQTTIGGTQVDPLLVGECVTKDISVQANPPPGSGFPATYYLGAGIDADSSVYELREDNNTRAESTVQITL